MDSSNEHVVELRERTFEEQCKWWAEKLFSNPKRSEVIACGVWLVSLSQKQSKR